MNVYKIPRHLPPFSMIWEDIGKPHPTTLADALGVDARTVRRWLKAGDAPRPVALALFWLTRWGQSELNCDLHNRAMVFHGMVDSLNRELSTLRNTVAQMQTAQAFAQAAPWNPRPVRPRRYATPPPPPQALQALTFGA